VTDVTLRNPGLINFALSAQMRFQHPASPARAASMENLLNYTQAGDTEHVETGSAQRESGAAAVGRAIGWSWMYSPNHKMEEVLPVNSG
jgi:hypothetical protein